MDKDTENEHKSTDIYYLSTYSRDDAPQIVQSLSNKMVAQQLRLVPIPYSMSDAMEWFGRLEEEAKHPDTAPIHWAIRETSSRKLIGDLSLREADNGVYSLGYWLAFEHWGQGIMTRALSEVLRIVRMEILKVKVMTAGVRENNWRSQRVLEKSGFRRVGEHVETIEKAITVWDFELELDINSRDI